MEVTPRDARTDWIDSWSFILVASNEAMALKRSREIFPPCPCVVHFEMSKRWTLCWRKSGRKKDWRGFQNLSFDDFCPLSCTDGMKCTKMYFARAARFFPSFNTLSTWSSPLPLSVSFLDLFNIHWHYLVALFSQPMLFFILAIS